MKEFSKYVGLDTHKDTIAVAVADALGGKPRYYGEIANTADAIHKRVKRLSADGEVLSFCYEAGPCGYEISPPRLAPCGSLIHKDRANHTGRTPGHPSLRG